MTGFPGPFEPHLSRGSFPAPGPPSPNARFCTTLESTLPQKHLNYAKAWSDSPYAPKIPYSVYAEEKTDVAGIQIAAILYGVCKIPPPPTCPIALTSLIRSILGILVVLFFQCMNALFNPANRRGEGIKWGLVTYTVLMFSFTTILTGMGLNIESLSYIDNREFPGAEGIPPGPLGYRLSIWSGALTVTPRLAFLLNTSVNLDFTL